MEGIANVRRCAWIADSRDAGKGRSGRIGERVYISSVNARSARVNTLVDAGSAWGFMLNS
jgi:hypothetical protein